MDQEENRRPDAKSARIVPLRPRGGTARVPAKRATTRLRTLFLIDELDIGGTEQQILEIVRSIDRDQFEPHVCCFRYGRKAEEIARLGVPVIHEPKKLKADFGLVLRLAARMRQGRYDLVQTYLWTANTWGRLAARLAGIPVVVASERNVDIWEETYKRMIGRWLARSTDRIIANSEAVRRYLLERGGLRPEKVVTIYNGVDFGRFRNTCDPSVRRRELGVPEDAILAGIVARVEPAKDHVTLLQAMALVHARHSRLHLAIVGDGSELERLRRLSRELGIADRVYFTGFRTDSAEWIQTFDFSVLSSLKEGLSNTVIESMAAGRPIVATDVGGNREVIVPEETGLIVPPRDPGALAAGISRLAASAELRARFGQAGRRRVETMFAVPPMVESTERLYLSLIASHQRAAA